ncbi:Uncharacterised protein [Raoultella planticola]|nr:Uncharacterised protein [Raoultella planticola]
MAARALPGLRSGLRDYVAHCIYCPMAAHALPGLRSGLRNYVAHRIYCPVAARALPGLRSGLRDYIAHRIYCPVAARALPALRSGLRDYVPHRIYCPVAARALPGLRDECESGFCRPGKALAVTRRSVCALRRQNRQRPQPNPADTTRGSHHDEKLNTASQSPSSHSHVSPD